MGVPMVMVMITNIRSMVAMIVAVGLAGPADRRPYEGPADGRQDQQTTAAPKKINLEKGSKNEADHFLVIEQHRDATEQAANADGAQLLQVIAGFIVNVFVRMTHR
jgi:hypothetical protein